MKNAEVQIKYECPECEGAGRVQNPCWAEFFEQSAGKNMTIEEEEKWFEDRGYMEWSKPYMGQRTRLFPDEELPCNECEGSKVLYKWVAVESLALSMV